MKKLTKSQKRAKLLKQLVKARKRRAKNARLALKKAKKEKKLALKQAKIDAQNKIWLEKAIKAKQVAKTISLRKDRKYAQHILDKRAKKHRRK